mgnify:FL=1
MFVQRKRLLFTLPLGLAVFTLLVTFLASQLFSGRHTFKGEGLKRITMEHLANGTFAVDRQSLNWLAEGALRAVEDWRELIAVGCCSWRRRVQLSHGRRIYHARRRR